jgi:IS30 family transposase
MIADYLRMNNLPYSFEDFTAKGGNQRMNADRKMCYKYLHSHGWTIQQIADAFGRDKSTIWSSLK